MNNSTVRDALDRCASELDDIDAVYRRVGGTSELAQYLTRYALIRACGGVEVAYKSLVADYCSVRSKRQVKNYLTKMVRGSSSNPSFKNICWLLKQFDDDWHSEFKRAIKARGDGSKLKSSLQSLVDARNSFAHGGAPTLTLRDVRQYFDSGRIIVEAVDAIIR